MEKGNEIYHPTGHENPVRAVAYSPDGKTIATGAEDSRIAIWDEETGKLRNILQGHRSFVNDVVFSPDGSILASASQDNTIKFWNLKTSEATRTLLGHADGVTSIAFSPDGKLLASASDDGSVRLWPVVSGENQILKGPTKKVTSVSFSPDGKTLVGGSDDGKIFSWDVSTGKARGSIQSKKKKIAAIAFNPANPDAIVSIDDNTDELDFWGLSKGTQLKPSIPVLSTIDRQLKSLKAEKSQPQITTASTLEQNLIAAIPSPPGGPILIITNSANKFGEYYAEILRNEGFNYFSVSDITSVTAATLANYDIAILADMSLSAAQVTTLSNWVNNGGNLIAMHPDVQLATLLGLTATGTTLSEGYLQVDTSKTPGKGIVNETIQFHGTADRYNLNGASSLATLYTNATTATANNPAVTLRSVGNGQAAAFTYDLARSVVYTRQGNPAWAGQERDSQPPIRSDDQFFGNGSLDWVNLDKVAIPQADEQQRLLANLLIKINLAKKPLPRFWYLPNGKKAVVLMTGDDHGNGGTANRFNQFISNSTTGCNVDNWECIRGTSYIYPNTAITNTQVASFTNQGFEIALHVNTNCADYTPSSLASNYTQQLAQLSANFPSLPAPVTQRHHCLVWSDWSSTPEVELSNSIRLDTTYYYWPPNWVSDRPGFFTGSGMPMRFTKTDGTLLDVYKAATQMTDESGQSYPFTINTLLDRALGAEGYYGVFNVNAHTDNSGPTSQSVSDAVVAVAKNRGVSVISAKQLLTWLDGRNSSSFNSLSWNSSTNQLSFSITKATGANGLQAMLPTRSTNGILSSITLNGSTIYTPSTGSIQGIKGVEYALFASETGSYVATYTPDTTAPQVVTDPTLTPPSPANGATNVSIATAVSATFNEAIDPATINASSFELRDGTNALVGAVITYDAATRRATLNPISSLTGNTTYSARLKGGIVKDTSGNALATDFTWTFTTAASVCPEQQPCSIWTNSTIP
ncbi:Ig-like domain-containing protein, partial [Nostoc sp. FACHB-110]|nr:Ig-like domain-containing protein [Nostoc sp. FACHB-110]